MDAEAYKKAAGDRLRQVREALGFRDLRAFAKASNITEDALGKYELGKVLVRPWYVSNLRKVFGIDHNWIFDGDLGGLRHDVFQKLTAYLANATIETKESPPDDSERGGRRGPGRTRRPEPPEITTSGTHRASHDG